VQIERLLRERDSTLKSLINQALRLGLREMSGPRKARKPFRTRPIEGVKPLLPDFDNIAEVIAFAEGDDFK
jgi:hypothetical protein